ncbi:MAG: hypothetical protein ACRDCI_18655 [Plesiomonas shigelloides]
MDFAKRTDELSQFSSAMGVAANDVQALGNALAYAGGDAGTATSLLAKLTEARDALAVKGNAAFLEDAAYSGIDPSLIKDAANSYDALMNIVGEFDSLSAAQQRTLAQTLGLSPSDIALFKTGRESVQASVEQFRKIRPATEEAAENSRKLRSEMSLLGTQIGAVADQISVPLVGALGNAAEAMNTLIGANRPFIDKTVGEGVEFATDNFTALAVAIGGLAAGSTLATLGALAKYIPGIGAGLGTIATNMGRLGTVAGLVGVSSLVASAADSTLSANVSGYDEFDANLTRGIYDLTGLDLSRGNVYEGTARQSLNPWAGVSDPYIRESQRAAADRSDVSQRGLPPVQVTLQLDGRVLDERIIDVNERTASSVVEDLQTTTSR